MADELTALADSIRGMSRDEAEARLRSLKVADIKRLAAMVDVRLHSGAPKDELIATMLQFLIDLPRGAEVIRNLRK